MMSSPKIFKGICHVTLSNTDDNGRHQISIQSHVMKLMKQDNKG